MKDDPRLHDLNKHEKMLLDYIKKRSGQNEKQIIKKIDIGKNTVPKYLKTLCNYGLIDFVKRKQGGKSYYFRYRGTKTFAESQIQVKNEFDHRKELIIKCINSLENVPHQKAVRVYSNCIQLILSYDSALKFIITFHKQKKPIKQWLELQEKNQELLDKITTGMSGTLYGKILLDLDKTDRDILDELELFMKKIKKL